MVGLGGGSLLSHQETGVGPAHAFFGGVDVVHPRARRPAPDVTLEPFERVCLAFRGDFHAAIRQVAHPTMQPLAARRCPCEDPEADSLNAAADQVPTREAHGETKLYVHSRVRTTN